MTHHYCFRDSSLPEKEPTGEDLLEEALAPAQERRFVCANCGIPITTHAEIISIEGSDIHQRTNPAGVESEFGCFARAPGVLVSGIPTAEHSWYAGYLWSFALCGGCGVHLGWYFEGLEPPFYGLILNRLREEGTEGPSSLLH